MEEFRNHFSKQSPITDAKFISHRRIGYVGFRTPEDAVRAVKHHNRSFIRMSKIGVELARSVDEQRQALGSHKAEVSASKTAMTHTAKEHQGGGDEASDAAAPARKRRRLREKDDEGDEKIQEFLQVMQPPSKSRAWENQDVLAVTPKPLPTVELEVQTVSAANENGNRDYEPAPKKQKKSRKEQKNLANDASNEHVVPAMNSVGGAQTPDTQVAGGTATQPDLEALPAVTDDDWLRSRTSRLLGLVDNDETPAVKAPEPANEKTKDRGDEEGSETESEKQSDLVARTENLTEDEGLDHSVPTSVEVDEPPVGNSRLFMRNLTYTTTEDDIRKYFEGHGYEGIEEVGKFFYKFFFRRKSRDEYPDRDNLCNVNDVNWKKCFSRSFLFSDDN